jgi:hypothetical protein
VPVFVKRKAADLVIATFTTSLIKYLSCQNRKIHLCLDKPYYSANTAYEMQNVQELSDFDPNTILRTNNEPDR